MSWSQSVARAWVHRGAVSGSSRMSSSPSPGWMSPEPVRASRISAPLLIPQVRKKQHSSMPYFGKRRIALRCAGGQSPAGASLLLWDAGQDLLHVSAAAGPGDLLAAIADDRPAHIGSPFPAGYMTVYLALSAAAPGMAACTPHATCPGPPPLATTGSPAGFADVEQDRAAVRESGRLRGRPLGHSGRGRESGPDRRSRPCRRVTVAGATEVGLRARLDPRQAGQDRPGS